MKKLRITVDGKTYEVTVEILGESTPSGSVSSTRAAPVTAAVSEPASSAPKAVAPVPGAVPSPLAGKVIAVDVQPGQAIEAGANLITLEAMKMNTFVTAPRAGTVDSIQVKVGDPVEEGQALLILS